jgi:antitoxin (DNA-binding transcriptional repressor) of toxin-antitoxin stability system
MTTIVNVHEAKTNLSRLLALVEQGEDVAIARRGQIVARLVAETHAPRKRRLGTARGTVTFSPGWDAPLTEEELAQWYGPVGGLDKP